jgi:hypothetical protein
MKIIVIFITHNFLFKYRTPFIKKKNVCDESWRKVIWMGKPT